jgi:heme-degrading monooxygenase HmoA
MATLPWSTTDETPTGAQAVVLGSRLELRHYRTVPSFLLAALRVQRQVRRSPGALGVSLLAQPARKTFWTLSAWADETAIQQFVRQQPHLDVMRRFGGRLTGSQFTTFTVDAAEIPPARRPPTALWRDARQRLANANANATNSTPA